MQTLSSASVAFAALGLLAGLGAHAASTTSSSTPERERLQRELVEGAAGRADDRLTHSSDPDGAILGLGTPDAASASEARDDTKPSDKKPESSSDKKKGKDKKKPSSSADPIVDDTVGADLDAYMSSATNFEGGFCGAVLVAKGGEILLMKGYGVADADKGTPIPANAMYDWCSVTKQFTAAAILKLEMAKKLSIEDSLRKIFPKCPDDKADITLRMLLNHTSGLRNDGGLEGVDLRDREAAIAGFLALPVVSKPGTKWAYNNVAYFLLAAIVEKVSGTTLESYTNENLFVPAGMEARWIGDSDLPLARVPRDDRGKGKTFAYGPVLTWGYKGAGGVVASTRDMLLWHQALLGDKILNAAAKQKYYTVGLESYALGWTVKRDSGHLEYSHSGHTGKVVTYYLRWPEDDVVVAIAYSYEPPVHPEITAGELARRALAAKVPARRK